MPTRDSDIIRGLLLAVNGEEFSLKYLEEILVILENYSGFEVTTKLYGLEVAICLVGSFEPKIEDHIINEASQYEEDCIIIDKQPQFEVTLPKYLPTDLPNCSLRQDLHCKPVLLEMKNFDFDENFSLTEFFKILSDNSADWVAMGVDHGDE